MRTSSPISTINYTSRSYLLDLLDTLLKAHIISFWFFVHHLPEDDEKKEHDHLFIELAKRLQTEELRENFREYDPSFPDKPLSVQPFRISDFENAYLYFIHDPDYLASKNMTRKYHYSREQVETSDDDYLDELIHRIDRSKYNVYGDMRKSIASGDNFGDFLVKHRVPLQQINSYKTAFLTLAENEFKTFRNGRKGHEESVKDFESRDFTCVLCGEVVKEADAVVRKGNLCTCRNCLAESRKKNPVLIPCIDYDFIVTERGLLDAKTGKFVDDVQTLDDLFISPELLKKEC